MNEQTLGDILATARTIPQTVETPTVDRIMDRFNNQWQKTAEACVQRAEELEAAAADLRKRAEKLLEARVLTDEVKGAVQFEIEARNRHQSLSLVNPFK